MRIKNKTYKIVIIIFILLFIFLLYIIFRNINSIYNDIIENKKETLLINSEIRELDNFRKDYKNYKLDFEKIDQSFVDPKNPISFVEFLEKTTFDSNISTNINLLPDDNSNKLKNIVFQIFANGKFSNILNFSEKLETGPYLVKIKNLTIRKSEQDIIQEKNILNNVDADFLIEVVAK